ncbi:RyR domain-containing protein [Alteromonas sp. ASW11-36]|uniref:RyR domain-containing protein n=1 Tax=Alteromonas arenosi TaxID=3055817 RepID=A0ABT7SY64_9ALTE|nr:RyR domain-containing protein [Alteromonas sp. ASW11-36]MDM7861121.1 RyR domain-containing protein [Alteromonas sp. ASW11-36]
MSSTPDENNRIFHPVERLLVGGLGVIALVLGILGFQELFTSLDQKASLSDLVYATSRLYLLDFPDHLKPPLYLDIARWLAPATLSYTLFRTIAAVARGYWHRVKIRYFSEHAVVVGLSESIVPTIRSLNRMGIQTVVIEPNKDNPLLGAINQRRTTVLYANPHEPQLMRTVNLVAAQYLIAGASDDTANIESLYAAYKYLKENAPDKPLKSVCCIDQNSLMDALYSLPLFAINHPQMSTRIVSHHRMTARLLVNNFGPESYIHPLSEQQSLTVTLVGDDPIVAELVIRFAEIGVYGTRGKLTLQLVGRRANTFKSELQTMYPALSELVELDAHEVFTLDRQSLTHTALQLTHDIMYVCTTETNETLLSLQSLVDLALPCPIIAIESGHQFGFNQYENEFLAYDNIHFASVGEDVSGLDNMFGDKHDKIAMTIHNNYVAKQNALGETEATNSSLVDWTRLPEVLKNANRNQADHIGIKCRILTGESLPEPEKVTQALNSEIILRLAKMEHQRWIADKKMAGWQYTDGEKDPIRRLSPSLIEWDDLSESEKQKDIDTVEQLPELLALIRE